MYNRVLTAHHEMAKTLPQLSDQRKRVKYNTQYRPTHRHETHWPPTLTPRCEKCEQSYKLQAEKYYTLDKGRVYYTLTEWSRVKYCLRSLLASRHIGGDGWAMRLFC